MAGFQQSTYYDRRHRQSPALIRARRPYLVKNAVLGLTLATISAGIYAYTLNAIGQDEFEDVKVPDAPVRTSPASAQNSKS
ncbi:Cytochrome c oxidase assembly factor 3 [Madurella fahalii]|uniref:Cytochrome c oxidase assembly factor 3 n=1 Tax=Madurella fahalii TaxID=1157608 RepID=A0ABQ0FXD7_9PEZI